LIEATQFLEWSGIALGGTYGGGLLAEPLRITPRRLSIGLHVATGVVLSVVAAEIVPKLLGHSPAWLFVLCLAGGGLLFVGLDWVTEFSVNLLEMTKGPQAIAMLYVGQMVDMLSDGLMLGAAASVDGRLFTALALGVAVGAVPQAFAVQAALKNKDVGRAARFGLLLSQGIPFIGGALLGRWLLAGASHLASLCVLAATGGFLVALTVEEIVPQAHVSKEARLNTLAFSLAFATFLWIAEAFG
jgi:ZIP family zinc transporter